MSPPFFIAFGHYMKTVDLVYSEQDPEDLLYEACDVLHLIPRDMGTLKRYPGSRHWHFSKARQSGVLECTWWPLGHRFWIYVAKHRDACWIENAMQDLKARLG